MIYFRVRTRGRYRKPFFTPAFTNEKLNELPPPPVSMLKGSRLKPVEFRMRPLSLSHTTKTIIIYETYRKIAL